MIHVIASEGGGVWTEYTHLLSNSAHWLFEITTDIVIGILLYRPAAFFWNRWHYLHDRDHHSSNKTPVGFVSNNKKEKQ